MTIFDAHGVLTFRARHRIRESLKGGGGILYYLYLSSNLLWRAASKDSDPSLLDEVLKKWTTQERRRAGRAPTPSLVIVDAQSVPHASSGGGKGYDAGKKVSGIKRHIGVDT